MVHVTDELIAGHAAGGLTHRERLGVALHLVRCVTCRALHDEYERAWGSLAHTAPRVQPPRGLRAKVLGRARAAGRRQPARPLHAPRLTFAFASVALAGAFALSIVIPAALDPAPALGSSTTLSVFGGSVEIERGGSSSWQRASDGTVLYAQDRVRTAAGSRAVLTFFDGSTLTLEEGTDVLLADVGRDEVEGTRSIVVFQTIGRTWSAVERLLRPGSRFEVRTPSATATVRGTGFEVAVDPRGLTTVTTNEGSVAVRSDAGEVLVTAGHQTVVRTPAAAPQAPARIAPRHELRFRANVGLLIITPAGLACGRAQNGSVVRQAPRCDVGRGEVTVSEPQTGAYRIVLTSDTAANARLAVRGTTGGVDAFERSAELALAGGGQALGSLTLAESGGVLSAGDLSAFQNAASSPARIAVPTDRPGRSAARGDEAREDRAEEDRGRGGNGRNGNGRTGNERDENGRAQRPGDAADGDQDRDKGKDDDDPSPPPSRTPRAVPTPQPRATPPAEKDDDERKDGASPKPSPTPRPGGTATPRPTSRPSSKLPRLPTLSGVPSPALPVTPPSTDDDEDED